MNLEFIKDSIQLIQLFSDTTDGKQIKLKFGIRYQRIEYRVPASRRFCGMG